MLFFHCHDGEGRLTLDHVSKRTADASSRSSVSHSFAYHGMPYLLQSVFQAWHNERPWTTPPLDHRLAGLSLHDYHLVIQAQCLGVPQ
jgi:hypothetical protein